MRQQRPGQEVQKDGPSGLLLQCPEPLSIAVPPPAAEKINVKQQFEMLMFLEISKGIRESTFTLQSLVFEGNFARNLRDLSFVVLFFQLNLSKPAI